MASFVAVLVDPETLTPQSLPVLSPSMATALRRVNRAHPELHLHGLFDKGMLALWCRQIDSLGPLNGRCGYIALLRDHDQAPISLPILAPSLNAAVDHLHAKRSRQPLDGLFERSLLVRWMRNVEALEQAHQTTAA